MMLTTHVIISKEQLNKNFNKFIDSIKLALIICCYIIVFCLLLMLIENSSSNQYKQNVKIIKTSIIENIS